MTGRARLAEELALAGREHLDPAYVAGYDAKAGYDPAGDLERLRRRGLGETSILIDLGAGTGVFALAAAAVCERVIAVDVSPAMIAALRTRVAAAGATNVDCVQAGFLSYDHSGPPADVVHTRNALHHLPDLWKAVALDRMAALLRPDGTLYLRDLVFSWEPSEAGSRIDRWLERAPDSPDAGWTRAELEEHLRSEFSTYTWLLEPMLERAGFAIATAEHDEHGVHALYVCSTTA